MPANSISLMKTSIVFALLHSIRSSIYLFDTHDGSSIDFYDCVVIDDLSYCRRPTDPINLTRTQTPLSCDERQAGIKHRFSDLQPRNISISTVLHRWKSSIEQVEALTRFAHHPAQPDQELCQCEGDGVFGKDCEYQLPVGATLEQTLDWQVQMREANEWQVQMHGNITCYKGIACDSGLLCLDWREICDGTQNCMFGLDEENCDILEMNVCGAEEYRCSNGMCIPDEYFLDGELDCLDWSDEGEQWERDLSCSKERVSVECDDRICYRNQWSCGDGQCIKERFAFHTDRPELGCVSRRDQYFMCETHRRTRLWTMPNGRCNGDEGYAADLPINSTMDERCRYLLKCALSRGAAKGCPCQRDTDGCATLLSRHCSLPTIQYPKGAFPAPFLFFYFSTKQLDADRSPNLILFNGTVKCRNSPISMNASKDSYFYASLNGLIKYGFCSEQLSPIRFRSNKSTDGCFRANESTDICREWNPCMSVTRIKDGSVDCVSADDELVATGEVIEKSCELVQRHRFRCSLDQPACLSARTLGDDFLNCQNGYDELWHSRNRRLVDMKCDKTLKDDCSLLRQYITQSWSSMDDNTTDTRVIISFRSYCDTFSDLLSNEDENLAECQQWWQCTASQTACGKGRCIDRSWMNDADREWDCVDASDEEHSLNIMATRLLGNIEMHPSKDELPWASESCHSASAFICLSPHSTDGPQWHCLNQSQLGDEHIDCLGAIDERNTLTHCSSPSSMLGYHFLCASTNTCISFYDHCEGHHRCPTETDDDHWCSRSHTRSTCDGETDFECFNGTCVIDGRCDKSPDCLFGEDEYMCDHISWRANVFVRYRSLKQSSTRRSRQFVDLPSLPSHLTILQPTAAKAILPPTLVNIKASSPAALVSPYACNRGIGILSYSDSIVCFCPPHFYGKHCEYHADRLLVLFHLNLSQSTYTHHSDPNIVLKLLVLLLFDDQQVLMAFERHVRPAVDMSKVIKKMVVFPYPRSARFRQHRQDRRASRTDIIHSRPYSIRIEAYAMKGEDQPALVAVWQYPIIFDHLPVFRLAKVLHLVSIDRWDVNPCASQPCPKNAECHPLMNDRHRHVCLCKGGFTGENCTMRDEQCQAGHCARRALCKAKYRSLLRGEAWPYCVCPRDWYGDRCEIRHEYCEWHNPCQHGGTCYPTSRPNEVFCLCTSDYRGTHCEKKKPIVHLSIAGDVAADGVSIQYFQIDHVSLELNLDYVEAYRHLPKPTKHLHDSDILPEIIVAKVYSPLHESTSDLYLLSVTPNATLVEGTTTISDRNHCRHVRTISNGEFPRANLPVRDQLVSMTLCCSVITHSVS